MPLEWPTSHYPKYAGAGQVGQLWYSTTGTVTAVNQAYYSGGTYTFTGITNASVTAATTWYAWNNANSGFYQQAQWAQWQGGIVSAKTKKRAAREQATYDAEVEARRRRYEEECQKATDARLKAQARARALLMTSLTPAQRESLEKFRFFDIEISGKTYRIHQGTHGNVRQVENGREVVTFCAQPEGVPTEDAMLAQKLMLETDEAAFLRVANARRL